MLEKASKAYNCEECNEQKQISRNCENKYPSKGKRGFLFAIGSVKYNHEIEEKTINECPTGYISSYSWSLWSKYIDFKVSKELGMIFKPDEIKRLYFEAFKIFMQVESEHLEKENNKKKPKNK